MMLKLFLDPGHGGTDSGAVGNGLKEKDLTLGIALECRRVLLSEYASVSLPQRINSWKAWIIC